MTSPLDALTLVADATEIVAGALTAFWGYIFWASGYLDLLIARARENRWGLRKKADDWADEFDG